MASTKEEEFAKIADTTLRASTATSVSLGTTDPLTRDRMTQMPVSPVNVAVTSTRGIASMEMGAVNVVRNFFLLTVTLAMTVTMTTQIANRATATKMEPLEEYARSEEGSARARKISCLSTATNAPQATTSFLNVSRAFAILRVLWTSSATNKPEIADAKIIMEDKIVIDAKMATLTLQMDVNVSLN